MMLLAIGAFRASPQPFDAEPEEDVDSLQAPRLIGSASPSDKFGAFQEKSRIKRSSVPAGFVRH